MGELLWWKDAEVGVHAVVSEAAELGAEDGVSAGSDGDEVDVDGLSGNGVLLEAHLGDGEAVDDVLGAEAEVDFAVGGKDELGGDEVVGGVRIGGIDAYGIAFSGCDELGFGGAEGGVRAGIAEVPGELRSGDFDLKGCEGGSCVASVCPEALSADAEAGEEDDEGDEREVLDSPEMGGFGAAARDEADEQDEVGESGEGEDDPEVEEEVLIEGWSVSGGVCRKRPGWSGKSHGLRISRVRGWISGEGNIGTGGKARICCDGFVAE